MRATKAGKTLAARAKNMSLTPYDDLYSSLVPLACNSAVDTKSCVGFYITSNAHAFPHIIGKSPDMSQSGTAFESIELVGHSP